MAGKRADCSTLFWAAEKISTPASAQSVSVFAGVLKAPSKLVMTPRGNLLVAEGGDGPNKGRVSLVDRKTRARRTVLDGLPAGPSIEGGISGLTTTIDVLAYQGLAERGDKQDASGATVDAARLPDDDTHFLVLEFSTNFLQNQPGRLLQVDVVGADGPRAVPASGIVSPTSMARDPRNGDIFVTSIFPGLVVRISHARSLVLQHYRDFLERDPDRQGWDFWAGEIEKCDTDDACN